MNRFYKVIVVLVACFMLASVSGQLKALTLSETFKVEAKSNNWDSILKDYEKFVDQYIALMKKVNAGDMSAMTQAMKVLEQATALSERMDKASGDLTAAQSKKLLQIQKKLANAAASMM